MEPSSSTTRSAARRWTRAVACSSLSVLFQFDFPVRQVEIEQAGKMHPQGSIQMLLFAERSVLIEQLFIGRGGKPGQCFLERF